VNIVDPVPWWINPNPLHSFPHAVAVPRGMFKRSRTCPAAAGQMHLVPTHFEEGGMRFRRRSRSAASARESLGGSDQQARQRMSLETHGSPHRSKRSSFEAGLHQNLKAAGSPRASTEKIRRQGNAGSTSDFLPTELIQRSRLFNTRAGQPQEENSHN